MNKLTKKEEKIKKKIIITSLDVREAIRISNKESMSREVLAAALVYLKKDPTLTVQEALNIGLESWGFNSMYS